jgi:hypothetical protein
MSIKRAVGSTSDAMVPFLWDQITYMLLRRREKYTMAAMTMMASTMSHQ